MTLTFTQIIPILLVFLLYFAGLPIVYALFGSTFFYFLVLDPSTQCWLLLQKVKTTSGQICMKDLPKQRRKKDFRSLLQNSER